MNKSEQFFFENAGFSYDPKTETKEQGRERCAKLLARAEKFALENNFSYEWQQDSMTSEDYSDNEPFYPLWVCIMRDSDGNIIASLGGVDFGEDGEPWGNNYRRVFEAELALDCEQDEEKEIFVAGYNMAGYMPDCEPSDFETFDDAKRYIISVIKNQFEEQAENEEQAEDFHALAEDVNLQSGEFSVTCNGYAFWVSKS